MPEIVEQRQISLLSNRSQRYIDKEFTSNETKSFYTTKIDLFPTCLSLTFTRSAFLFYFAVFMLQIFFYSPLSFYFTFIPIILTFLMEALLNVVRFIRRKKLTFEIDRRKVTVLRENTWIVIPSRALAVGDIIKLNNGDVAPADLILLWTANGGQCGIDTHIIDGSVQLKARKPNIQISKRFTQSNLLNCYIRNIQITRTYDDTHKLTSKIKFQATIDPNEIEISNDTLPSTDFVAENNQKKLHQNNRSINQNQSLNLVNNNNNMNNNNNVNNNNNNNNDISNNNIISNSNINHPTYINNNQFTRNINSTDRSNIDNSSLHQQQNVLIYTSNNNRNLPTRNYYMNLNMNNNTLTSNNASQIHNQNPNTSQFHSANPNRPLQPNQQLPPNLRPPTNLNQPSQSNLRPTPNLSQSLSSNQPLPNLRLPNINSQFQPNSISPTIQIPQSQPSPKQQLTLNQNSNQQIRSNSNQPLNTNPQLQSNPSLQSPPNPDSQASSIILNNSQFIERYSVIYQVSDVVCAVAFTGDDCRNLSYSGRNFWGKMTKLEVLLNKQCLIQIGLILLSAIVMGIISLFYTKVNRGWPFYEQFLIHEYFLRNFWYYVVLLMPLCPLEIYLLIDFILYIHTLFISSENGTIVANTSALDELTQVDTMILSKSLLIDKKINIMLVLHEGSIYVQNISNSDGNNNINMNLNGVQSNFNNNINNTNENLFDIGRLLTAPNTRLFFLHLAICHTAVPFIMNEYIGYISNFVEEESLLKLAEKAGYVFCGRTNTIQVKIYGMMQVFPVLITFPPSPTHPRISIIFRDVDGTIKLFTRGNIDNMREFTNGVPTDAESNMKSEGYQVICCSYKIFTSEEIQSLQRSIPLILRGRPEAVFGFANSLEKNSTFLSLIAIQEEPRKGTFELINHAKQADIQIVLTSPFKMSWVAITALSFGLIQKGQKVGIINGENLDQVRRAVDDIYQEEIETVGISSCSIEFLPQTENGEALFRKVKIVFIEKAEPQNVADFVSFLKSSKINKTVLGAGHSIYDSVFLEKSNVSVSVRIDSASPCDFSCDIVTNKIEEIDKLIFVHGNLIRERINSLLHFIFPKNSVFAFFECIFGLHSAASGTPLFTEFQTCLALGITSIPALSRAVFNKKVQISYLENKPEYYDKTRVENRLSGSRFIISSILSFCAAFFVLAITKFMLHDARTPYGDTLSLSQFSFTIESLFVVCSFCFLAPTCTTWTKMHHLSIWGSLIVYFLVERAITDTEKSGQRRGAAASLTSSLIFTLMIFLFAGVSTFLTFSFILWRRRVNCACSIDETFSLEQYLPRIRRTLMSNYIVNVENIYNQ